MAANESANDGEVETEGAGTEEVAEAAEGVSEDSQSVAELLADMAEREKLLSQMQRALKKPSTIPLAQRMDLMRQASGAVGELSAARAALEVAERSTTEETTSAVRKAAADALEASAAVLAKIGSAQPAGMRRGGGSGKGQQSTMRSKGIGGAGGASIKAAGRGE